MRTRTKFAISLLCLYGVLPLASCDVGGIFGSGKWKCGFILTGRVTNPDGGGKKGVSVWFSGGESALGDVTDKQGSYELKYNWDGGKRPDLVNFTKDGKTISKSAPEMHCGSSATMNLIWPRE